MQEFNHGPLGALFTVNEEDGFTGINAVDPSLLKGKIYINVENEVEGQFVISSAGGIFVEIEAAFPEEAVPAGMRGVAVAIDGLRGGHSGADIDKGRASAHQLMARLLWNAPALSARDSPVSWVAASATRYRGRRR